MQGQAMKTLYQLIEERQSVDAEVESIDQKIWAMFGETWTVFCSDMTGFTLRTEKFGIIHFLSLIYSMQKLVKPLLLAHNGLLLKTEADNLFVIFRDPQAAVNCALAIHQATKTYNENRSLDNQILLCIGIGHGKVLKLGDQDCFGNEVNKAFKLGEDIARGGETLLTAAAYEAVKEMPNLTFSEVNTNIALIDRYYKLIGQ